MNSSTKAIIFRHLAQDVKRRAREKGGKPVSYFFAAEKDKIR